MLARGRQSHRVKTRKKWRANEAISLSQRIAVGCPLSLAFSLSLSLSFSFSLTLSLYFGLSAYRSVIYRARVGLVKWSATRVLIAHVRPRFLVRSSVRTTRGTGNKSSVSAYMRP